MIQFHAYTAGRAPTARVARVGGIYREESGLIRLTWIDSDERRPAARAHLLLEPWQWLESQELLDTAVDWFKRGMFAEGGPRQH